MERDNFSLLRPEKRSERNRCFLQFEGISNGLPSLEIVNSGGNLQASAEGILVKSSFEHAED